MKRHEIANTIFAKAQLLRKEADRLTRVAHQAETGKLRGDKLGDAMGLRILNTKIQYGAARDAAYKQR